MAPSDGMMELLTRVLLCYVFMGVLLCSEWLSAAELSCVIGSLDARLLMKEYSCSDYANKLEIEKSRQKGYDSTAGPYRYHNTAAGERNISRAHHTFISSPNVSVALLPKLKASSCYIFKYQIVKQLEEKGQPLREVSVHANFSCDYQNLCQNQDMGTSVKMLLNGVDGELYCCNKDNCNKEDAVSDLPPRQQLCYNASNDGTTKKAALDYCTQPDTRCARARRTDPGREEELYFCDNLHHCQNHSLTSNSTAPTEMCKMVKIDIKEIELCCCSRNKCYVPQWLNENKPQVHNKDEIIKTKNPGLSWLFIGGLILMALVSAAMLSMIWMGIRHCRRRARDNIMTLTYTRLTVSVPEPGREDVQMLLE